MFMSKDKIIIYTDGSSLGNPGPGGWGSIIVAPVGVMELGGSDSDTTNNRMELTAVIEALNKVKENSEDIIIYTDSSYTINGITKWVEGWQANNWIKRDKTEVLNRDLWDGLISASSGKNIRWRHVAGHSGMVGNERADDIATSFAKEEKVKLYEGSVTGYGFDISDISYDKKMKSARDKMRARSKIEAYSYLSLVDGVFKKHPSWKECEERVKGKKGVKYRKAISADDELSIKKEWGV